MAETPDRPKDSSERRRIREELDRCLQVEASAGTGKTEEMIGRMVALLAGGYCKGVEHLAAITFTRKAAAEMRSRFQMTLERSAAEAAGDSGERLRNALLHIDTCFVGTIHSFCARLLRERPIEAAVDLDFREMDEDEDTLLREEAWDLLAGSLIADAKHPAAKALDELREFDIPLLRLRAAFLRFADYPDIDEWPRDASGLRRELESLWPAMQVALQGFLKRLGDMKVDGLPDDDDTDVPRLVNRCKAILRQASHMDDQARWETAALLEALEGEAPSTSKEFSTQLSVSHPRFSVKALREQWKGFADGHARPVMDAWRACAYEPAIRLLQAARDTYDSLRRERAVLNYQDLLMRARDLLKGTDGRDPSPVRQYFRRRFTHILVDEFQDTDPVQAEVLLLLAGEDDAETDWRRCRPRPGALFVVGDPKQSIYRFRRADIVTYNQVKSILCPDPDKDPVFLSSNFRSTGRIVDWVNAFFSKPDRFPQKATAEAPAYVPLVNERKDGERGYFDGLRTLVVPLEHSTSGDAAVEYEADFIARTIRKAVVEGQTITRAARDVKEATKSAAASYDDFMIITWRKNHLHLYARAMEKYGIPHHVTGGTALNALEELRLLYLCLNAVVRPDDPVALVAVLRSELFGVSDCALYDFQKAPGEFDYRKPLPAPLAPGTEAIADAVTRLSKYATWIDASPLPAAIERIVDDLGLIARAAGREGGGDNAGGLAKALELLRAVWREDWSVLEVVDYLKALGSGDPEEQHDGISALPGEGAGVSILNLHKAKGLQAPVVFLADPNGKPKKRGAEIRVVRPEEGLIKGYLRISMEWGEHGQRNLGAPERWAAHENEEQRFIEAEWNRLYYVAATRAGSCLVVCQRTNRAKSEGQRVLNCNYANPWSVFEKALAGVEALPEPGGTQAGPSAGRAGEADAAGAERRIRERLGTIAAPTYAVRAAREFAKAQAAAGSPGTAAAGGAMDLEERVGASDAPGVESTALAEFAPESPEEHGFKWGSVTHRLLDIAMRAGDKADLERRARDFLAEEGVSGDLAPDAVAVVRAVAASPIWQRALKSKRRYTECPFEYLLTPSRDGVEKETLLRGVIDLVFEENDGWVIVDYKSDHPTGKDFAKLITAYRPQVELYARVWRAGTREKVKEIGVFFTTAGRYFAVREGTAAFGRRAGEQGSR